MQCAGRADRNVSTSFAIVRFSPCTRIFSLWIQPIVMQNGFLWTHNYVRIDWLYWSLIMAVGDAHVFPGYLTPVLTQLFFPKPPTIFLIYFSGGERRKYARKKVRLNRVSNKQPTGHEPNTLTSEPSGRSN